MPGLPMLIATLLASASPALVQTQADPAALLRKGCVETGLDAARLEQTARTEGWVRLRITHVSGEPGRIDAFFAEGAQVMLTGDDAPEQAVCAVMVNRPQGQWRAGLSDLALDLGLEAQPSVAPGESAMWFAPDNYAMSYTVVGGTMAVSLSHAHVSTEVAGEGVVVHTEQVETVPQRYHR